MRRLVLAGGILAFLLVGAAASLTLVPVDGLRRQRVPIARTATPLDEPGAVEQVAPDACPIQLRDVTSETGIAFRHTDGSRGDYFIVETVTAGLATFDYDGDGLIDIYFPNGAPLAGPPPAAPPRDALYRNLGGFRFREVTDEAGLGCTRFALGVTVGDYDGDGHPDLYVSNFGPNALYRNNGDGTFTDTTTEAGVSDGHKLGAGSCFLDVEGDGDLDMFVANYVQFSFDKHVKLFREGRPFYVHPDHYLAEQQTLLRNNGDGTFTDVSQQSGIAAHPGKGMGIVCSDFDSDGDTDIFVLNDIVGNSFFVNDGAGRFEEASLQMGLKYNGAGLPLASMGVDCADYDNDGLLDFFQTSYEAELTALFRNRGSGDFADVTRLTGAGQGTAGNVKWGCAFADFDNDSHRDIFVAMGHVHDQIEHYNKTTSFRCRNVVLRNNGQGRFENVSDQVGDGLFPEYSSRGAAFDDLDNDGDIDAVVLNTREMPNVLRNMKNESGRDHHWLQIRLRGVASNRDGVGAQVKVVAGGLRLVDEVHSGRGYQSHFGSRLHFGLAKHARVERIEVRWIGGGTDVFEDVAVDRLVSITEGGKLH